MNNIKDLLKLLQIVCVIIMPAAALYYYFPALSLLGFTGPFNSAFQSFFSGFTSLTINGTDWTLVFIIIPWVLFIIILGMGINIIDGLAYQSEQMYQHIKVQQSNIKKSIVENEQKVNLQKKQIVYMAIQFVFSKFTISTLSDDEFINKKTEVKNRLLKDLSFHHGKLIEDEEFDDDDTLAVMFFSQDDALNFILKFKEQVAISDNEIQTYGYSLAFKSILDSQTAEAMKFYILQFMERALRTLELNEICTTNDFANRYREFGKMKQIEFTSKGNYSINKERVELNRLSY